MKIYLSGSYSEQARLREESHKLFDLGHHITSSWLNEAIQPSYLTQEEWYRGLAVKDLAECAAADCIVCDLDGVSTSGGRYVEWGFSIGRFNMLKLLVGSDTSGVFGTLADKTFKNWSEVVQYFTKSQRSEKVEPNGNIA